MERWNKDRRFHRPRRKLRCESERAVGGRSSGKRCQTYSRTTRHAKANAAFSPAGKVVWPANFFRTQGSPSQTWRFRIAVGWSKENSSQRRVPCKSQDSQRRLPPKESRGRQLLPKPIEHRESVCCERQRNVGRSPTNSLQSLSQHHTSHEGLRLHVEGDFEGRQHTTYRVVVAFRRRPSGQRQGGGAWSPMLAPYASHITQASSTCPSQSLRTQPHLQWSERDV